MKVILDCYTDEPAGLGVPPFLGVYPRYIYGMLKQSGATDKEIKYITIDDLRLFRKYDSIIPVTKVSQKTDISVFNLSANYKDVEIILNQCDEMIVVSGAHTSGKYLSAYPGNPKEVSRLLTGYDFKKYLAGPSAQDYGSSFQGGQKISNDEEFISKNYSGVFDIVDDYKKLAKISIEGAIVSKQCFTPFVAELETARGCSRKIGCSFCLEPCKNKFAFRNSDDIIAEATELRKYTEYFRLGKQSCFFSYQLGDVKEIEKLLIGIHKLKPKVLHIDNVNPAMVTDEKTKLVVKYCTEGNIAAFGVESFDPDVAVANNLNSDPEMTLKAIRILNKYGSIRGKNGMPKFLPGINILFGLTAESKKTHKYNMEYLNKILDEDLLLRRINIRQVIPFIGTKLYEETGNKILRRNKKYYWKWRNEIRQKIDFELLKKLVPLGSIIHDVYMEIYDGKHTFGRQFGTYPLIIGMSKRVPIRKFYSVRVIKHNLRSIEVELVE